MTEVYQNRFRMGAVETVLAYRLQVSLRGKLLPGLEPRFLQATSQTTSV